jgi:hypothetical protein
MRKKYRPQLFLLALFLLFWLPLSQAAAANPPNPGDVLINEYVANSSVTEWVELVNTTASDLDISGYYIDDIANGGGSPKQIPSGTIISAGGYWTMDTSRFFNNSGDDARLLMPDGATVVDSSSYGHSAVNKSWYRTPDGGAWSPTMGTPTKGAANN